MKLWVDCNMAYHFLVTAVDADDTLSANKAVGQCTH